jgi:YidC/Oxa1 family membrane protein insertase
MNIILEIYNLLFYQPIYKILSLFYLSLKDFGLAIIFLTILVRLVLFPLNYKSAKDQKKILKIQKEMEEINKKHRGEEKTKEILALYKREKINPFFSLLSLLIQFPILVALYQVFLKETSNFNPSLFKILDLSQPNFIFVLLVVIAQFFYSKISNPLEKKKKNPLYGFFQGQMNFFLSAFTFLILFKLPSAISLYLITNYLFLIIQKIFFHV